MKKGLMIGLLGGLLALNGSVRAAAKYTCTLTGKTVETCCCVEQKDGKLYCTLAKETIDTCCCKPARK